ncbi:MAG: threonine/serine exporter family protein [Candidatus Choladocola sp.]|nr:threonine/serine exporter family protein [Candidatus Choladocola sp.]
MMIQILAAMAGTVAFSVLFGVPGKFYPYCGAIGGFGWAVYIWAEGTGSAAVASLLATMAVVLLSRLAAVWKECPVTIFLVSGIFPLVPGTHVYWTAYYFVTDQLHAAAEHGYMAVKIAFAIVLGIVFVFEIPQKFFLRLLGRTKTSA